MKEAINYIINNLLKLFDLTVFTMAEWIEEIEHFCKMRYYELQEYIEEVRHRDNLLKIYNKEEE